MKNILPIELMEAWEDREGPVVLTTTDSNAMPNSIYASIVNITNDGRIAVADNYFYKTKANIDSGSKASVLFITKKHKSYQVKGTLEYYSNGAQYEEMLTWADPKHPRKGVVILNATEVYSGREKLA
ncbi:MAG: pyridoxamine 5'-phosphate oxidase family protein [Fibrobacter sp.]|nr:pyridoxamine 5'-phosphate oxidase family protein [Fibrobacter sp.]